MDLERMRDKCHKFQWKVGDLDWDRPPPKLSREDEIAVVQYFTDMATIERLAGALFVEQAKRTEDPVLKEIFESFVKDELRHSHCAQMLADHYDVNRYKVYQTNPALLRFFPHFIYSLRFINPEFANLYITTGELILDVALLRSLDDFVDDEMSHEAMDKINQDESRHIAIDFHMVEYYSSEAWSQILDSQPPRPLRESVRAYWAYANVFRHARPFFKEVFFTPMERCDPTGRRMKEAFKRIQLLGAKPRVRQRPIAKFLFGLQDIHNHRIYGKVFGRLCVRILGVNSEVLTRLYTDREASQANAMSFDELAAAALQLKHSS
jgi:hypothetical protein